MFNSFETRRLRRLFDEYKLNTRRNTLDIGRVLGIHRLNIYINRLNIGINRMNVGKIIIKGTKKKHFWRLRGRRFTCSLFIFVLTNYLLPLRY